MNKSLNRIEDTRLLKVEYLAPKYWGVWLFIGFLWLASLFPFSVQWQISRGLAFLTYHLAKKRRRIAQVNIEICFPELSPTEKEKLVKQIFHENMQGYLDSGTAWFRDYKAFKPNLEVKGKHHLDAVLESGQGVVMAGAHFSILDLAGALTSLVCDLNVTYRPLDNKLMNAVMMRGRYRFVENAYHKKDVKGFINCLKRGEVLWYAPDQDYGRRHSVFAPFFNKQAATVTGLTFLSESGNAQIIPYSYHRNGHGQTFTLEFYPPLPRTGDEAQDASNYNTWLESVLRRYPAQYLWLHKRFKTQQNPDDPNPYK
ncbi:lipid A biosynthesis acyltransferase [Bermanella sp. R86510]|uniref:LpxL/LpxP family acyltransferase n=1 Tax=unclassified Bermanella TaxID=2627862 RepID=UPI0037CC5332